MTALKELLPSEDQWDKTTFDDAWTTPCKARTPVTSMEVIFWFSSSFICQKSAVTKQHYKETATIGPDS